MRIFGIEIAPVESTTLSEVEEADAEYNRLRSVRNDDDALFDACDELAARMHRKGFLPHYDKENDTFYFVDAH